MPSVPPGVPGRMDGCARRAAAAAAALTPGHAATRPRPTTGAMPMSRSAGLPVEELRAERDMLAYARECLAAMRRRAESLRVVAGDPYAEEAAAWRLRQRVASLADDPDTALFFGRLDYGEDAVETPSAARMPEAREARFYVGRRHVVDAEGDPVVVDWRAGAPARARPAAAAGPGGRGAPGAGGGGGGAGAGGGAPGGPRTSRQYR